MKKIYLLISTCLLFGFTIQAQKQFSSLKNQKQLLKLPKAPAGSAQKPEAACDTVNYPAPDNWNLTLYIFNNGGGFVSGTNAFDEKEMANYFDLSATSQAYISGARVYFAVANSSILADLSKNVVFKVYADAGGEPGSQIGSSVSIPLSSIKSDVDNSMLTKVLFPSAIALPASKKFYVSVDISNFSFNDGDSIAIVSTKDGDLAPGTGTAWGKLSDDSWANFNSSVGLDAALVILPFVSPDASSCLALLPVKLYSFTAQRNKKDVSLSWSVADEINMKGYEIEKAGNNNIFKPVGFINAQNDLKSQSSYSYTDMDAFTFSSTVQYRLKQIDDDGNVQYSRIIPVKLLSALSDLVFANPFSNTLRMQLNIANPSIVSINMYDMKGNLVVSEKPAMYNSASNSIVVSSTSALKSGVYILKLSVGNEQFNYKIVKQ